MGPSDLRNKHKTLCEVRQDTLHKVSKKAVSLSCVLSSVVVGGAWLAVGACETSKKDNEEEVCL